MNTRNKIYKSYLFQFALGIVIFLVFSLWVDPGIPFFFGERILYGDLPTKILCLVPATMWGVGLYFYRRSEKLFDQKHPPV